MSIELGRALSVSGPMALGDVPQFSIVAFSPDSDPDWWMMTLQAPHYRRRRVMVLGDRVNASGSRSEETYSRDVEVHVIASPVDLGLAMLYDRDTRRTFRDHGDWMALITWRRRSRALDLISRADGE